MGIQKGKNVKAKFTEVEKMRCLSLFKIGFGCEGAAVKLRLRLKDITRLIMQLELIERGKVLL